MGSVAHSYIKDHLRIQDLKIRFDHATEHSIIYAVPGSQDDFEYLLTLPGKKIIFDTTDYSKILMARAMITIPKSLNPYIAAIESIGKNYDAQLVQETLLECHKSFMQYYEIPATIPAVCKINYVDLFQLLDQKLPVIFKYLQLSIDHKRWEIWQPIYAQYQQANQRDFCTELVSIPSVDYAKKTQILKEILNWKNGLSRHT